MTKGNVSHVLFLIFIPKTDFKMIACWAKFKTKKEKFINENSNSCYAYIFFTVKFFVINISQL